MTSPKKGADSDVESTFFSQLSHMQKQTKRLTSQLAEDIEKLQIVKGQFVELQKQVKVQENAFVYKATIQLKQFQQKVKNSLVIQKAQFKRFANQINELVSYHKQINIQLIHLANKFEQYKKDVGI